MDICVTRIIPFSLLIFTIKKKKICSLISQSARISLLPDYHASFIEIQVLPLSPRSPQGSNRVMSTTTTPTHAQNNALPRTTKPQTLMLQTTDTQPTRQRLTEVSRHKQGHKRHNTNENTTL